MSEYVCTSKCEIEGCDQPCRLERLNRNGTRAKHPLHACMDDHGPFDVLAQEESKIPPCEFCGRLVLAGVCCQRALDKARS